MDKIKDILIHPRKLIENISETQDFKPAMLILFLLFFIVSILTIPVQEITINERAIISIERYGIDYISEDSQTNSIPSTVIYTFFAVIVLFISTFISGFFVALLLSIITKIFGGKTGLMNYYCLVVYGYIIEYVGNIFKLVFNIFLDSSLNVFSLAILYPKVNFTDALYNFLSSISVFGILQAIFIGLGISIFNKNFSKEKSIVAVAIYYIIIVLFTFFALHSTVINLDILHNIEI